MSRLTIIVAATKTNGIGQNANLPWRLAKEMKYFAQVTSQAPEGRQNAVVMGRNTWESIPKKFRPLPNRVNLVVSRNNEYQLEPGRNVSEVGILADNLPSGLAKLVTHASPVVNRIFIIGGGSLYKESLSLPASEAASFVDRILLTRIVEPKFECDAFMPDFTAEEAEGWIQSTHNELQEWVGFAVPEGIQEEKGVKYEFQMWTRRPSTSLSRPN